MIAVLLILLACGTERWDVKTAKDDAAAGINATPQLATIQLNLCAANIVFLVEAHNAAS